MAYEYEPLEFDGESIRLFWLRASTSGEIEITLIQASLEQYQTRYEAVSYTWGSKEKQDRIIVNGRPMLVTRNLFNLLHSLRRTMKDRVLWIDAICIDQGNSNEQSHQVQHMRNIYASAARVVFWLGPGTADTNLVMIALAMFNKSIHSVGWPRADNDRVLRDRLWMNVKAKMMRRINAWERQRSGLRDILTRPWFQRVWVIQEVANARRALVQCGVRSVSCRMFALAPQLYKISPKPHCQSILDAMPTPSRPHSWWARSRDLYNLLLQFRRAESHLECDKIYALLGICAFDQGMGEVIVDYEKPVQQVVKDAISHICFCQRTYLPDTLYPTLGSLLDDLEYLDTRILSFLLQSTDIESARSILQRRRHYIHVSPSMFRDAVENTKHGHDLVQLLLNSNRAQLKITEEIIISAARNLTQGDRLVEALLQNIEGESLTLTQGMLISASQNPVYGSKIMKLLLKHFPQDPIHLTTALFYTIATNENEGEGIEKELVHQWGARIEISEDMAINAAQNGGDLMKLLTFMERRRDELRISDDLLIAAAKNPTAGPANIDFLLQKEEAKCTRISQKVIISAAENAISGREVLRVLLKYRDQEIDLSEKALLIIAQDSLWGLDFLMIIRTQRGRIRLSQQTAAYPDECLTAINKNRSNWSFINGNRRVLHPNGDANIGHPILWWSIHYSEEDLLRLLLQNGTIIDIGDSSCPSPVYRAAEVGSIPIIQLLLQHGARLNQGPWPPLFGAIICSQIPATLFLLEKGARTDIMDWEDWTPLGKAALIGNLQIVQSLLQWGAMVDNRLRDRSTALMIAADSGHLEVVDTLLKHGAHIGATDEQLFTALHYAAEKGNVDVIRCLLANGADINAQDRKKQTPLEVAIAKGKNTAVKVLVEKVADSDPLNDAKFLEDPEQIKD